MTSFCWHLSAPGRIPTRFPRAAETQPDHRLSCLGPVLDKQSCSSELCSEKEQSSVARSLHEEPEPSGTGLLPAAGCLILGMLSAASGCAPGWKPQDLKREENWRKAPGKALGARPGPGIQGLTLGVGQQQSHSHRMACTCSGLEEGKAVFPALPCVLHSWWWARRTLQFLRGRQGHLSRGGILGHELLQHQAPKQGCPHSVPAPQPEARHTSSPGLQGAMPRSAPMPRPQPHTLTLPLGCRCATALSCPSPCN